MKSNNVKEYIKEIDKQIESFTKQLNDVGNELQKLKKTRLDLVELQDYQNYEKWDIHEGSCYIRFPEDYSGTLCQGFIVTKDDNNANLRPDVIVHLPDNKHVIIDSKVSLVAYDRLVNAQDKAAYETALKEHVASLKKHVAALAAKNYPNLPGLNAPDFVLMFVPIEAMFAVAVEADQNLFAYAWEKKIVIVSPTTLLATLRTMASIWQQENQTKNALEIARLGGVLYDKLVGFIDDFQKIKRSLDAADKAYNDALGKMSAGKGNMLNTAERIKELGAKAGKTIPQNLLQDAEE